MKTIMRDFAQETHGHTRICLQYTAVPFIFSSWCPLSQVCRNGQEAENIPPVSPIFDLGINPDIMLLTLSCCYHR